MMMIPDGRHELDEAMPQGRSSPAIGSRHRNGAAKDRDPTIAARNQPDKQL
jgi:hypothetical protein